MPNEIKEWFRPVSDLFEDVDALDISQFVVGVLVGMGLVARQILGRF